jgi:hypothetical protein
MLSNLFDRSGSLERVIVLIRRGFVLAVLPLLAVLLLVSTPAAKASTHCRSFAIHHGRVTTMAVSRTSCRVAERVVKDLYAGKGTKTYPVRVDGWRCYSGTGLTSCSRRHATLDAQYRLR